MRMTDVTMADSMRAEREVIAMILRLADLRGAPRYNVPSRTMPR